MMRHLERSDDGRRAQSAHIQQQLRALTALGRGACQTCGGGPGTHLIGPRVVCARCAQRWRDLGAADRCRRGGR